MRPLLTSAFERWTAGERSASLYAYGAAAWPASLLYRAAARMRPALAQKFPTLKNARLIVISSPLVGGVGKTPMAALIATRLRELGQKPAVVTLGHGRSGRGPALIESTNMSTAAADAGDEAAELHLSSQCPVHVDDEPADAISRLDRKEDVGWIVFDDGVSRGWAGEKRVVVMGSVDLENPVGYLPFGRWRTSPRFVRFAHYLAITSEQSNFDPAKTGRLRQWGFSGSMGFFHSRKAELAHLADGRIHILERPPAGSPLVFCAIARPNRFGADVAATLGIPPSMVTYPDHFRYTHREILSLDRIRSERGCGWFLTTLKDAVKIDPAWLRSTPLFFLRKTLEQHGGDDIITFLTGQS